MESEVVSAIKVLGKIVTYEDGSRLLLLSPGFEGIGQGATLVFLKPSPEAPWAEMSMRDALPYVMRLARDIFGTEM